MNIVTQFNDKVNFVDENDVFVGYDLVQCCCEYADWYLSFNKQNDKIDDVDHIVNSQSWDVSGYVFDTNYFNEKSIGESTLVEFRLVKPQSKNIYLTLFNVQNGYYSHGFEAKIKDVVWKEGYI